MRKRVMLSILLLCCFKLNAADCFDLAGRDYNIDPDLLRAISWNESRFDQKVTARNSDGSYDTGAMQINSQHFSALAAFGITRAHIENDVCMNIYTGAYILAGAFRKWGVNWQSVGAYNAGFRQNERQALRRYEYARKIEASYLAIKASRPATKNQQLRNP